MSVVGPSKNYEFRWRILNYEEIQRGRAIKHLHVYVFDFKQTLFGDKAEVTRIKYIDRLLLLHSRTRQE